MLGSDSAVSQRVTDAVVALGWLWVFSLLFALPIGIYIAIYNVWRTGTVPDIGVFAAAINPGFVVLGAAAAVGGLVLLLANATFGSATVDTTLEQAQDLRDEVDDGE